MDSAWTVKSGLITSLIVSLPAIASLPAAAATAGEDGRTFGRCSIREDYYSTNKITPIFIVKPEAVRSYRPIEYLNQNIGGELWSLGYTVSSCNFGSLEEVTQAFGSGSYGDCSKWDVPGARLEHEEQMLCDTNLIPSMAELFDVNSPGSAIKRATVFFRQPTQAEDERGYPTTTFDIEYQLIACMGELHLAYSLVEGSVRQDKPGYWLNNQYWSLKSPPPAKITSLPLKGSVYIPPLHNEPIGTFGDNFAGPALGFGCFSGQTKKIANLKDHVGESASKEEIQKFIEKLEVSFETSEVLRSAAAEEEIRSGMATAATPPPLNESVDRSPTIREAAAAAEAAAAERRAAREAEFQAKVKRYEEELAAQQAAVEEYEAAKEQVAAEKAANAAKAQAAQEEFARQRAAYEAELERHRQQQADYEAQIGAASVTTPEQ